MTPEELVEERGYYLDIGSATDLYSYYMNTNVDDAELAQRLTEISESIKKLERYLGLIK